ncbi:hypothetical protein BT63DRAFT_240750 [Microthyrium microscopicum]|uniref:Uncharacterized protein n=1 Tax=Microthyrium microscopicum TaxID=703497 RepID=A0A6A6UFW3_9PEZI|nr:hypothetical protein BT63DRAFT_240750 [Microthyrium microscopicum]
MRFRQFITRQYSDFPHRLGTASITESTTVNIPKMDSSRASLTTIPAELIYMIAEYLSPTDKVHLLQLQNKHITESFYWPTNAELIKEAEEADDSSHRGHRRSNVRKRDNIKWIRCSQCHIYKSQDAYRFAAIALPEKLKGSKKSRASRKALTIASMFRRAVIYAWNDKILPNLPVCNDCRPVTHFGKESRVHNRQLAVEISVINQCVDEATACTLQNCLRRCVVPVVGNKRIPQWIPGLTATFLWLLFDRRNLYQDTSAMDGEDGISWVEMLAFIMEDEFNLTRKGKRAASSTRGQSKKQKTRVLGL